MRNAIFACSLAVLAGCGKPATSVGTESPAPAAKAAEFKKRQGLLLTPEAVEFIGLRKAEAQAKADRVVLPRQALLRTSEGVFVFVANGQRWLRTPVKVGTESAESAEITDGVLEGDLVVVAGVWDLWMAELQAIKGGVGCADGH
jgi:multidrug efflux pump subunit AcrA (membrane-fusion protein)